MHQTFRSAFFAAAATIAVAGGVASFSKPASACNVEPYIGTICTYSFDWCPQGYVVADGRTLTVRENQALFALIGYRYGGNNADLFGIPDLRGRAPIGTGTGPGLVNIPIGAKVGQQELLLSAAQVPLQPHTHAATFTGTGGGGSGPMVASGPVSIPLSGSVSNATVTGTAASSAVTGTISAKALSPSASGGINAPTAANNTVGKVSGGSTTFYPPSGSDVAVPTTFALNAAGGAVTGTASGGTLSGNAAGTVSLPVTGATGITGGTVAVAPAAANATQKVSTQSPALGQTVCIATSGLYPNRP